MNRRAVANIIGKILITEGILMLPSVIIGIIFKEIYTTAFLPAMAALLLIGLLLCIKKPQKSTLYAKEGFFIVGISWILLSIFGAVPLYLLNFYNAEYDFSLIDCIFEIASGFTTTGATVFPDVEALPHCILFWRSFTHWVGGMGVLMFVMAIMPLSDDRSLHLMRAEVPGPVVGKLVPKMSQTAKILYAVYAVLTAVLVAMLCFGGMNWFDALCNAFGTAGTGGFSIKNAGIGAYGSAYIEIVLAVFMVLFGINFNLYYFILIGNIKEAISSEELHTYLGIIAASVALISWNTIDTAVGMGTTVRNAFFQVASVISTSGFATVDYAQWPLLSQTVLIFLMIVGGCAGSTGGGLKVSRLIILCKSGIMEIRKQIHPRANVVMRLERKPMDTGVIASTLKYFSIYIIIIMISVFMLSFEKTDFLTVFTAELACFNNIGPGLGAVGPYGNFAFFSPLSKIILTLNMWLGRLEIFPILILFSPDVWKGKKI